MLLGSEHGFPPHHAISGINVQTVDGRLLTDVTQHYASKEQVGVDSSCKLPGNPIVLSVQS
jgi:hypothetical protein